MTIGSGRDVGKTMNIGCIADFMSEKCGRGCVNWLVVDQALWKEKEIQLAVAMRILGHSHRLAYD